MSGKTTMRLLITVIVMGVFILVVERRSLTTDMAREAMRKAFEITPDQVESLRVRTAEYDVHVQLVNGEWQMAQPVGARAHGPIIMQVLSRLATMDRGGLITPEDMRQRGQALADFGLAVPKVKLELMTLEGPRSYHIGNPDPLQESIYVKDADSANLMVVSTDLLQVLPPDGSVFRDRDLVTMSAEEVSRIDLITEGQTVRLERKQDDSWHLLEPVKHLADRSEVEALLSKLLVASVGAFVDGNLEEDVHNLASSADSIRIHSRSSDVPLVIRLGANVEENVDEIYAAIEGLDGVCVVSAGLRVLARTEAEVFRDRRVLWMNPAMVSSVELSTGEKAFTLARGEEQWTLSTIEAPEAAEPAANRIINQLAGAWLKARVERFEPVTNRTATAEGTYTITFNGEGVDQDMPTRFSVRPDPVRNGRVLVSPEGRSEVWVVVPSTLLRIPLDPLQYRSLEILSVNPDDVLRITSVQGSVTTQVVRAEEGWQPSVEDTEPDAAAVEQVLAQFQPFEATTLVAEGDLDLDLYGLADPDATLSLGIGGDSPQNRTLLLGRRGEDNQQYAMIKGRDLVFTLSTNQVEQLCQPLLRLMQPINDLEVPDVPAL